MQRSIHTPSPMIAGIRWGMIDVSNLGFFRDAKLYPGGGQEWDWMASAGKKRGQESLILPMTPRKRVLTPFLPSLFSPAL